VAAGSAHGRACHRRAAALKRLSRAVQAAPRRHLKSVAALPVLDEEGGDQN
jgi:hypothetical protein